MSQDVAEQNIQMWKVKKLIKSLDSARGYLFFYQEFTLFILIDYDRAGTSMISLIIPPKVRGKQPYLIPM
jgi:peptide chain release factor subunit 1